MQMQRKIKKAIFAGECMVELSGNISSLDTSETKMQVNFGGDTYNSAVYFARLCAKSYVTYYFTAVGCDKFSEMMVKRFSNENLNVSLIKKIKDKYPGLYSIHNDVKGNRSFSYWRSQSAAKLMLNDFIDDERHKIFTNCDLFYYSGISAKILEKRFEKKLIHIASKAKLTAFDFNFRKNLHTNIKTTQNLFKKINELVNINFVSYDDILDIYGKTDPKEFVQNISRKNNIILLRLHDHVVYSYYGEIGTVIVPIINAKDKTAAGDSFNGSFLANETIDKKMNIEEKILQAHELTRAVIKHDGAIIPQSKMPKQKRVANENR